MRDLQTKEEEQLLEILAHLQRSYEKAAEPYVKRLIQIRQTTTRTTTISKEQWEKYQSEVVK